MDTCEFRVACMGGTKSQLTNEKFTALGSSPCVQFVNVYECVSVCVSGSAYSCSGAYMTIA